MAGAILAWHPQSDAHNGRQKINECADTGEDGSYSYCYQYYSCSSCTDRVKTNSAVNNLGASAARSRHSNILWDDGGEVLLGVARANSVEFSLDGFL